MSNAEARRQDGAEPLLTAMRRTIDRLRKDGADDAAIDRLQTRVMLAQGFAEARQIMDTAHDQSN